jgi:Holliday junction resolvasome RuvABC endonuclease subunit
MAKRSRKNEQETSVVQGKLAIFRNPEIFKSKLHVIPPDHKRVVGLDVATTTGVAWCDIIPGNSQMQPVVFGANWDLSIGNFDTTPLRILRLFKLLEMLEPDLILFERVRHTPNQQMIRQLKSIAAVVAKAATSIELIGALTAALSVWAEQRGIPVQGVGIQEIKKFATGSGAAGKPDVIAAANSKFEAGLPVINFEKTGADNIADAMFLCSMGVENFGDTV